MNGSRQLAAIMFTDIVGYTAMMQHNEEKAVAVIKHYNSSLQKWVTHFNGQVLNYYGDGSLCTFSSATDAVNCSLELQKEFKTEPIVPLRIGLHIGEIFFEDEKALGDGVNVASRVQSLGQENTILLSAEVYDKIKNNASISAVSLGFFHFKNVEKSLEVYSLTNEGLFVPLRKNLEGKLKNKNLRTRKLIAALIILVFVASIFLIYKKFSSGKVDLKIDKSIAVLPFVDMSADKDQEYFSDGLSEELLNLLSKIPELKVIGRTSSFSFKGKNEDLRSIGVKLGVANILEGSVRKEGNNIRVSVQLTRAADGSQLWSGKYDRDLGEIFKLQDEIAAAVVDQLQLKLLAIPTHADTYSKPEVHTLILQGNYFYDKLDKENVAKALDFYNQARIIDSLNPRVWVELGKVYARQAWQNYIDQYDGYEKAREAVTKALTLDNNITEGHLRLANIKMYHDFDWNGAESELKNAYNLEPGNPGTLNGLGVLAQIRGHWNESIRFLKQAISLDPLKPIYYSNLGATLTYSNRLNEAMVQYKKILELNPQFQRAHMYLGGIYLLQGNPVKALAEIEQETIEVFKQFGLALAYHSQGRKKEADEALTNFITFYQEDWVYLIAEIYAFRGDKEKAFEWLEKAYEKKDSWLVWVNGDPLLKNLAADPRYALFLKKMKLLAD